MLLVVDQRLLNWSEAQPFSNERQEANEVLTCFHSAFSETDVLDLASSSASQFPAIPLWPGTRTKYKIDA